MVDQLMIASEAVTYQSDRYEITGGGAVLVDVVNVELVEVVVVFAELAEATSKSYVVPGVRPVSVTEWLVTSGADEVEEP